MTNARLDQAGLRDGLNLAALFEDLAPIRDVRQVTSVESSSWSVDLHERWNG